MIVRRIAFEGASSLRVSFVRGICSSDGDDWAHTVYGDHALSNRRLQFADFQTHLLGRYPKT